MKREDIESAVRSCRECNTFDPAPTKHEPGVLSVTRDWQRLAMDVTHLGQKQYFTIVDCGPSRFAIWREVKSEKRYSGRGGRPSQLLMDNSLAFKATRLKELCDKWRVARHFRAAYNASGNGIAERMHRTI